MVTAAADPTLAELAERCGPAHVRAAGAADTVGGVAARWVAAPRDTAGVAAVLAYATGTGRTVVPTGSGGKLDWAAPPSQVDILLELGRLAGVAWHAPADLVATVGAGTPLRAVQAALRAQGQRLSLDAGSPGATVGGMLATGEAGPLRLRHGTGRDLLLGVEFVRADGTVAHSGGRVVKNVAGYDVGKLLCGAYGTLGVLTSATFRLHPEPAARAWVGRSVRTPLEVHDLVGELLAAAVEPTAVEVDLPAAGGPGRVAVLLEGTPAGVAKRATVARDLLAGDASVVDTAPPWWNTYPFGPGDVALKLAVPVADLHAAVYALRDAAGTRVPVRGSAGVGVVFAALPGDTAPGRLAAVLDAVRAVLLGRDGSCVVLAAPAALRAAVDLWGPVPGVALMRRVKERFDPKWTLSPGRFVGGI
jgi:glycolate oxidase FAD binding subunit